MGGSLANSDCVGPVASGVTPLAWPDLPPGLEEATLQYLHQRVNDQCWSDSKTQKRALGSTKPMERVSLAAVRGCVGYAFAVGGYSLASLLIALFYLAKLERGSPVSARSFALKSQTWQNQLLVS